MTVHFAAARTAAASPVARALTRSAPRSPANDNGGTGGDQAMLRAALLHFAKHGLAAASEARQQALTAFFAGDRESYDWWRGICNTLDRRMARDLDRSVADNSDALAGTALPA